MSTTSHWKGAVNDREGIGDALARRKRQHRYGFKVLENDDLEGYVATAHWTLPGLWAIPVVILLLHHSVD